MFNNFIKPSSKNINFKKLEKSALLKSKYVLKEFSKGRLTKIKFSKLSYNKNSFAKIEQLKKFHDSSTIDSLLIKLSADDKVTSPITVLFPDNRYVLISDDEDLLDLLKFLKFEYITTFLIKLPKNYIELNIKS